MADVMRRGAMLAAVVITAAVDPIDGDFYAERRFSVRYLPGGPNVVLGAIFDGTLLAEAPK